MNKAVLGRVVGKKLCEEWGLDPNTVASIRIDLDSGSAARVTVEFIKLDVQERLVRVISEYDLVERPSAFEIEWEKLQASAEGDDVAG